METKRDTEPACQHGEPWPEWQGSTDGSFRFRAYLTYAEYVRARACVNACAGISTEALETGAIQSRIESAIGELYEVKQQRDALRDELAAAVEQRDRLLDALIEARPYVPDHHGPVQARILSAIASVEGAAK